MISGIQISRFKPSIRHPAMFNGIRDNPICTANIIPWPIPNVEANTPLVRALKRIAVMSETKNFAFILVCFIMVYTCFLGRVFAVCLEKLLPVKLPVLLQFLQAVRLYDLGERHVGKFHAARTA